MAPAKPGRVEAPLRSARRKQARGPSDRSGIRVKQFCACVPIILEPQSGCGTVTSSIRTADIRIIGESASAQPRTPNEAPGCAARSIVAVCRKREWQSYGELDEKASGSHCEHNVGTKTNAGEKCDSGDDVSRYQRKPNGLFKF